MDIGLQAGGLTLQQSFEIEALCCETLRRNFSHEVVQCDLSTRLVADERFPNSARPYTVREYARLQGVPDTFTFAGSDNDAYRMIGNGVSVPVGKWIGSEIVRYFK